jgi:hypothetical protein
MTYLPVSNARNVHIDSCFGCDRGRQMAQRRPQDVTRPIGHIRGDIGTGEADHTVIPADDGDQQLIKTPTPGGRSMNTGVPRIS